MGLKVGFLLRRCRRRALPVILALSVVPLLIGALAKAGTPPGPEGGVAGNVRLQAGPSTPTVPFVTDRAVVGLPGNRSLPLQAQASGSLFGWTSPVGVSSPDGRYVAYNAWTDEVTLDPGLSFSQQGIAQGQTLGRPSIHLLDVTTGSDTAFEDGAYSIAWRGDGAVAYFKGERADFSANQPYIGRVRVRSSLDADPVTWTPDPGRYTVIAWAGRTLLAYRGSEGGGLDLVSLSGPDQEKILSSNSLLVAVSPDGSQALVSQGSGGAGTARLLDVATGNEVASLDLLRTLDPATGRSLRYLSYGGSWVGDRIAAEGASGVVIFDAGPSDLTVDKVLSFPSDRFPMPAHEPLFTDQTGSRVVAWAPIPGSGGRARDRLYVYVDCDLAALACTSGPPRGDRVFSHVYNPSRPLPSPIGANELPE